MSTQTPSAASIRAAEKMNDALASRGYLQADRSTLGELAAIIDRETGLPELLRGRDELREALEAQKKLNADAAIAYLEEIEELRGAHASNVVAQRDVLGTVLPALKAAYAGGHNCDLGEKCPGCMAGYALDAITGRTWSQEECEEAWQKGEG